jgi:hypothetical protein
VCSVAASVGCFFLACWLISGRADAICAALATRQMTARQAVRAAALLAGLVDRVHLHFESWLHAMVASVTLAFTGVLFTLVFVTAARRRQRLHHLLWRVGPDADHVCGGRGSFGVWAAVSGDVSPRACAESRGQGRG